jgi:hypothetical protein
VGPTFLGESDRCKSKRLGATANRVHWLVGNITELELGTAAFDIWHDRAVFHFLTTASERAAYIRQVGYAKETLLHKTHLTPTGLLMEGDFTQNPCDAILSEIAIYHQPTTMVRPAE